MTGGHIDIVGQKIKIISDVICVESDSENFSQNLADMRHICLKNGYCEENVRPQYRVAHVYFLETRTRVKMESSPNFLCHTG